MYRTSAPATDLPRARALDPFSLDPYFAAWRFAPSVSAQIAALEDARRIEPRSVVVLYQLGLAYGRAGRHVEAVATLRRALALDPRENAVRAALHAAGR